MRHDENARDVRAAARDGALIRDSNRIDGPRAPHSPRSPHDAVVSRRAVLALSALTAGGGAAALTACADLPTNGEVTSSDAVSSRSGQLVQTAARPRDGAGPEVRIPAVSIEPTSSTATRTAPDSSRSTTGAMDPA